MSGLPSNPVRRHPTPSFQTEQADFLFRFRSRGKVALFT